MCIVFLLDLLYIQVTYALCVFYWILGSLLPYPNGYLGRRGLLMCLLFLSLFTYLFVLINLFYLFSFIHFIYL